MIKIRSLRRTSQSPYVVIAVKLSVAIVVSYIIATISMAILHKLNDLSRSSFFDNNSDDEDAYLAKWNGRARGAAPNKPFATILFWTKWFDEKAPLGDFAVKRCLPSTCHVTNDRAALKHADAVIFHSRDLDLHDLPPTRTKEQLWIFLTLESPFFSGIQIPIWRNISAYPGGMFNWTATYRRDSDIYCPYGAVRRVPTEDALAKREPFFENGIKNKSNRILWFAGNCHTMSNRELFVDKLKKLYPIDIYGPCGGEGDQPGDGPLDDTPEAAAFRKDQEKYKQCNTRKNEMDCWRTMAQRYRYYLSLENSFCRDYITEKFYRPLYYGLLPIVAGGHGTEDYKAIAPPNSFISAFDYQSPKDIAQLLRRLDRNATQYAAYFEWRKTHTIEFRNPLCACEICQNVIQELRRRHNVGLIKNHAVLNPADDDSRDRGLLVTKPKPDTASSGKPTTGSEVSRWWHDGACVVP